MDQKCWGKTKQGQRFQRSSAFPCAVFSCQCFPASSDCQCIFGKYVPRYREERIHELESRLARRCGRRPPDAGGTRETVSPEREPGEDGNDAGSGSDERDDRGADSGARFDAGTSTNSKLQKLSRQRKEIDAAIAAALEDNRNQDASPDGDRRRVGPERPGSAARRRKGTGEDLSHGRQRRQRETSGAESLHHEDNTFARDGQQLEAPTRPMGKPPRAPSRSEDRSRQTSGARRASSVGEVDQPPDESGGGGGGSNTESFSWGGGDFDDADEVRTEGSGGGGNDGGKESTWRDNGLSDVEGSVWEEPFSFQGWDGDADRSPPGEGDLPALMEVGEVHVQGSSTRDDPSRRQRHRVGGTRGIKQAGVDTWREERVPSPEPPRGGDGKVMGGGGVREPQSLAAGDLDDEASCNSRWSLSPEGAERENGAENGPQARRVRSRDEAGDADATRGQTISAGFQERVNGPEPCAAVGSETAERGIDDAAAAVPEYLEDFSDGRDKRGRGDDVPFAVSSPR